MVYVAFVIDVFARSIVGWRVSTSMSTQFVLDALNQSIFQRKSLRNKNLSDVDGGRASSIKKSR